MKQAFKNKTVLVTGGTGSIGSEIVRQVLALGPKQVRVFSRDESKQFALQHEIPDQRLRFFIGDVRDKERLLLAMQGSDIVYHAAAMKHVPACEYNPFEAVKTNIVGTHVLLEASLKAGVKRFHHVSTDEVFGSLDIHDSKKFTEATPYDPRSPYSASKASSDHLVRAYYHTYGLPMTITNCSNNYGPYQFPEKLIPLAITNSIEGKKVPVYGDGFNIRDWLYVEDHCRAIDLVLQKGKIGETYCIGGTDQDFNNLTIVKKILSFLGKDESFIEFVKDRPGHDRRYALDWSKIKNELGWEPLVPLEQGLATTVQWYRENAWWWKPLKSVSKAATLKSENICLNSMT